MWVWTLIGHGTPRRRLLERDHSQIYADVRPIMTSSLPGLAWSVPISSGCARGQVVGSAQCSPGQRDDLPTRRRHQRRACWRPSVAADARVYVDVARFTGTLPVFNQRCAEAGLLTSLALQCKINRCGVFELPARGSWTARSSYTVHCAL